MGAHSVTKESHHLPLWTQPLLPTPLTLGTGEQGPCTAALKSPRPVLLPTSWAGNHSSGGLLPKWKCLMGTLSSDFCLKEAALNDVEKPLNMGREFHRSLVVTDITTTSTKTAPTWQPGKTPSF